MVGLPLLSADSMKTSQFSTVKHPSGTPWTANWWYKQPGGTGYLVWHYSTVDTQNGQSSVWAMESTLFNLRQYVFWFLLHDHVLWFLCLCSRSCRCWREHLSGYIIYDQWNVIQAEIEFILKTFPYRNIYIYRAAPWKAPFNLWKASWECWGTVTGYLHCLH